MNIWRNVVLGSLALFLSAQMAFGWGRDAHRIINQVAIQALPADVPAFLRSRSAIEQMEYLGPEPDRWRSSNTLNQSQAPEHFIDLELADQVEPGGLPSDRYTFILDVYRARTHHPNFPAGLAPRKIGFLPWRVNEEFERLRVDMREYRTRLAEHRESAEVAQAILYDAGILGHFVADGSQPLHTTVNYNGWVEAKNPYGFTRLPGIHSEFESQFVHDNFEAMDILPLVAAKPRALHSPFQDFVEYLLASHNQVQTVYRLAKEHGFGGPGTPESRRFTADRIAAGAAMLRDMIYTAWLESAKAESPAH